MKTKNFLSALMIAIAIGTTATFTTSCDDDSKDTVENKNITVSSEEVYRTKDDYKVKINYTVYAECSGSVSQDESGYKAVLKNEVDKEVTYEVSKLNWENNEFSKNFTNIFNDIIFAQDIKNFTILKFRDQSYELVEENKTPEVKYTQTSYASVDTCLTSNDVNVIINYTFTADVPETDGKDWNGIIYADVNAALATEVKKLTWENDALSKGINEVFGIVKNSLTKKEYKNLEITKNADVTCVPVVKEPEYSTVCVTDSMFYSENKKGLTVIMTKDYYELCEVALSSCEVKYSDLGVESEIEVKECIFSKVNSEFVKFMSKESLTESYNNTPETDRKINEVLDGVLTKFEKHIVGVFSLENDSFEIVNFEIKKGLCVNYWLSYATTTAHNNNNYDNPFLLDIYRAYRKGLSSK